jgi:hypothetical protein
MKHICNYEVFEANSQGSGGIEGAIHDFFAGIESRFADFNDKYRSDIAFKTTDGQVVDTGLGFLIGAAGSLIAGVAKRLFSKNDFFARKIQVKDSKTGKTRNATDREMNEMFPNDDDALSPVHQRLLNNDFISKDLPNMRNDSDMQSYVKNIYKKNGFKRGENPFFDKSVNGMVGSYVKQNKGQKVVPEAIESGWIGKTAMELESNPEMLAAGLL